MRTVTRNDACPCGTGLKYKKCCGPALAGDRWPETPEALMRSRYTAYVTGDAEHLYRTAHPEHESVKGVDKEQFIRETVAYCKVVDFTALEVQQVWPPDEAGIARVLFTAHFTSGSRSSSFTEKSEFTQLDGRWVYRSGEELR